MGILCFSQFIRFSSSVKLHELFNLKFSLFLTLVK